MATLVNMRVNGRALRAIRVDRKATLRGIAATVGISASYLSLIERDLRGTTYVSDETVAALAAALSLPVEAIAASSAAA